MKLRGSNGTTSAIQTDSGTDILIVKEADGTLTVPNLLLVNSKTSLAIPSGTTAERDTPATEGNIRYNTTLDRYEGYKNGQWSALGGGAVGGADDEVFFENGKIVTANYTITAGKNAMSAGPVQVLTGASVTVPTGSTWTIL